jgi:predicted nuclease with TOPRIM domain
MEITQATATITQQIDHWLHEGAELIRVIPSVFEERDGLRRRLRSVEEHAHQLEAELTKLQGEVDRLQRGRAETAEAMETYVGEIGRLTDTLRLKVKAQ